MTYITNFGAKLNIIILPNKYKIITNFTLTEKLSKIVKKLSINLGMNLLPIVRAFLEFIGLWFTLYEFMKMFCQIHANRATF